MFQPPVKLKRKRKGTLLEDDIFAADAVTHETVNVRKKDGTTRKKSVLVPLVPVTTKDSTSQIQSPQHHQSWEQAEEYEVPLYPEEITRSKKTKVCCLTKHLRCETE